MNLVCNLGRLHVAGRADGSPGGTVALGEVIARVHEAADEGLILRGFVGGRARVSVTYNEIVTGERMSSKLGFRLHVRGWEKLVVVVRRSRLRGFEEQLRAGGVVIVDEFGARIDESQFAKEADREFNKNLDTGFPPLLVSLLTPDFVRSWRSRRAMRQWSDDG